jgi:hypothetical protein
MSIEQKIAEMLAESGKLDEAKFAGAEGGSNTAKGHAESGDKEPIRTAKESIPATAEVENEANAKNDVDNEDEAANATSKKPNRATQGAAAGDQSVIRTATSVKGMQEDIDALMNGEELSEEFRAKATTIFEAAVMTRVNEELARIEEGYDVQLQEATEQIKEGLVEQVDGYLDYVVEQWIAQNEIALEHGMKSEILEGFVSGLKGLFEEHYIDIPEEKFDVLSSLEEQVEELETKLNEQVAANVELNKSVNELQRAEIVQETCAGLADTEVEKLQGLAEELSYEDAESFTAKVQTLRENYFTSKTKSNVNSVVTDAPVDTLTEEKKVDPVMARYTSVLNRNK